MAENEKFSEIVDEIKEKVGDVVDDVKEKTQQKVEEIKSEIDDFTADQDAEDIKKNKVMAVLAYIGILVLIPLFCAKESKFARFHTNQGLVLFLIAVVCGVLCKIKLIGWIFGIVDFAVFILAVIGIVYAIQGKAKELPVVGNWKLLK